MLATWPFLLWIMFYIVWCILLGSIEIQLMEVHWFISAEELLLQESFILRTDVDCGFVCLEIRVFKSSSLIFSITCVHLLCQILYKTYYTELQFEGSYDKITLSNLRWATVPVCRLRMPNKFFCMKCFFFLTLNAVITDRFSTSRVEECFLFYQKWCHRD